MSPSRSSLMAAAIMAVALSPSTVAQEYGWGPNQTSTTMCAWPELRAIQVKNTVYLDGGDLSWMPQQKDGSFGPLSTKDNPLGLVYTLDLGTRFNTSGNISAILGHVQKFDGAPTIAPNFYDGALLGNNDGFYLFGGGTMITNAYPAPRSDDVIAFSTTQNNFRAERLPSGLTRYVTYGGAANAPSENKAFYFSGFRSPTWGEIYDPSLPAGKAMATNVSDTLITVDLSKRLPEGIWKNATLPPYVKGRANPELVWVPYGKQGMLLAIGGVTYPDYANWTGGSANSAASVSEGIDFMKFIDVYDVASGNWYRQETNGQPPGALTRGCTVVAPAQDMSSVSVYWYGGYNGVDPTKDISDDVYILSLPSFQWIKVFSGKASHGRAGHKCVMPYPDQMMVIGGFTAPSGAGRIRCLEESVIQVFNLTSLEWLDEYDPAKYYEYGVPPLIHRVIGGNEAGGATLKAPDPTGWAPDATGSAIGSAFAEAYPTSKITSYYPYPSAGSPSVSNGDQGGSGGGGDGGTPSFVAPVVGAIGGLIVLTGIIAAIIVYRRRHLLKRHQGGNSGETDENGNRIMSWMHQQPSDGKAPTVTATEDTYFTPDMETGTPIAPLSIQPLPPVATPGVMPARGGIPEMADTQVHRSELMDTSPRVELHDTGLTPIEVIAKHTHLGQNNGGSVHSSGVYSSVNQTDHASTVSRASGPHEAGIARPDSPALGPMAMAQHHQYQHQPSQSSHITSGVSGISERDRRHLRHLSDETVSSVNTATGTAPCSSPLANQFPQPFNGSHPGEVTLAQANSVVTPQSAHPGAHPLVGTPPMPSPPTAGDVGEPEDYLSVRSRNALGNQNTQSQLRRSAFRESEEDLNGSGRH